ncbi:SDR family NAD(P)-dependent oxidoreductase [Metabacillus lacus]|uniref:SDR family NAD(P)-dependent oxidoreductase n=1 Tax=Metabacillus lacus TaxID=1983721 RepID=UPI00147882E3|nr:SDR family oxidoreductase [Metabacillus lacus]
MENKVVIVTGATSGIGKATAKLFCEKGYSVIALGRSEEEGRKLEAVGEEGSGSITFKSVELTEKESVEAFFQWFSEEYEKLHVLFNNAGSAELGLGSLLKVEEEDWDRLFEVNLRSQYLMLKNGEKYFSTDEPVSIINNAASVGSETYSPALPAYSATKAGVVGLTKSLASRFAKTNIRVNSVSPGPVDTDLAKSVYPSSEMYEEAKSEHPRGSFGKPEEIAKAVYFLASEDSSYINGHNLVVDGGYSL